MIKEPEDSIPQQHEGTAVDVEETVAFDTEEAAKKFYEEAKFRLLNVNDWHIISGLFTSEFVLTDNTGSPTTRRLQEGDFFRIDIPGPNNVSGSGYDWVRIEEIAEISDHSAECISIRVRPTSNPTSNDKDVAHFYTEKATSNFVVKREEKAVTAGVYGRNEKPNIDDAGSLLDKARNAIVGTGGITFFSKLQWRGLVNGILGLEQSFSNDFF